MVVNRYVVVLLFLFPLVGRAQPWIPDVIWDRSGTGDHSRYGGRIFSLGDQNDDGFADWGVQAEGWGGPGQASEVVFDLFHGGTLPSTAPYLHYVADTTRMIRMTGAGLLGDVNGDGHIDWEVSAICRDSPDSITAEVFFGGPSASLQPDTLFRVPFNTWMQPAGDFNGDGFDDLYFYDGNTGIASVWFGGNPMHFEPRWQMGGSLALMIGFGDINGDGYADMLDYNDTPGLNIFYGGVHPDTVPGQIVNGVDGTYKFIVNDLNGDHSDEIIITGDPDSRLFFGRDVVQPAPDYTLGFPCSVESDQVVGTGDINHDGFQDFAMLEDWCDDSWWGTVSIYLGSRWISRDPVLTIRGREGSINLVGIYSVAGLGDVNGDSVNDFAIGAFNSDTDGWRGRVVIISGDSTVHAGVGEPRAELPQTLGVTVFPNPFNSTTHLEFTLPITQRVSLRLYDVLGREVAVMMNEIQTAGRHRLMFDASGLPSGVYLCRLEAGGMAQTRKMVLVK